MTKLDEEDLVQPVPEVSQELLQQLATPPEGFIDGDTMAAEAGMAMVQLSKARRVIRQLREENAALRKANEQLAANLQLRQQPSGAPAGSAPRSQRRPVELAARREAAKAAKKGAAS